MTPLLLATDFDGTVADIVNDPAAASLDPQMRELFASVIATARATVALVSGRDVDDLAARADLDGAWLAGSHGREIRRPDGSWLVRGEPVTVRPEADFLASLVEGGFRIEEKRFGLAIHWRERPEIRDDDRRIDAFLDWASSAGLETIRGRRVAEARASGADKKVALQKIAAEVEPERIVYAGDDLTDLAALEWVATRGRALFAASAERHSPDGVEIVHSREDLIAAFQTELESLDRGNRSL